MADFKFLNLATSIVEIVQERNTTPRDWVVTTLIAVWELTNVPEVRAEMERIIGHDLISNLGDSIFDRPEIMQ
ncbi:MAG: hypothetical protein ACK5MB_07390 [Phycisphaerales bacterium]|jgi:hypothetical protein